MSESIKTHPAFNLFQLVVQLMFLRGIQYNWKEKKGNSLQAEWLLESISKKSKGIRPKFCFSLQSCFSARPSSQNECFFWGDEDEGGRVKMESAAWESLHIVKLMHDMNDVIWARAELCYRMWCFLLANLEVSIPLVAATKSQWVVFSIGFLISANINLLVMIFFNHKWDCQK